MIYLKFQCKRSTRLITPRQVKYTTHSGCRPRETWLLEFGQNGNLTVFSKHTNQHPRNLENQIFIFFVLSLAN